MTEVEKEKMQRDGLILFTAIDYLLMKKDKPTTDKGKLNRSKYNSIIKTATKLKNKILGLDKLTKEQVETRNKLKEYNDKVAKANRESMINKWHSQQEQ